MIHSLQRSAVQDNPLYRTYFLQAEHPTPTRNPSGHATENESQSPGCCAQNRHCQPISPEQHCQTHTCLCLSTAVRSSHTHTPTSVLVRNSAILQNQPLQVRYIYIYFQSTIKPLGAIRWSKPIGFDRHRRRCRPYFPFTFIFWGGEGAA